MDAFVFLPQYSEQEYNELLKAAIDNDTMYKSWAEWKKETEKVKDYLEAHNQQCRFVDVKVNKLVLWCSQKGVVNTSHYRSEYITELGTKLFG